MEYRIENIRDYQQKVLVIVHHIACYLICVLFQYFPTGKLLKELNVLFLPFFTIEAAS